MKKIKLEELKDFNGDVMKIEDRSIGVKDVILNHLGTFQGNTGKENVLAFTIGQKIAKAEEVAELEDAEYELVKKSLERKPPIMTALAIGQTLQIMEKGEED